MTSLFPHPSPVLPPFKTLLVKGPYPSSAPIHLCLSHTRQKSDSRAILIGPDRQAILTALKDFNDHWLFLHGGTGIISKLATQVHIFYPPSPAHLALLLATLRVSTPSDNRYFNSKTHLDSRPSLFVILEPSFYFLDDHTEPLPTLSSYLSIVSHALATLSFLSGGEPSEWPSFALFDSKLDQLYLPILPPPSDSHHRAGEDDDHRSQRKEAVSCHAAKYFEWIGTFEEVSALSQIDSPKDQRRRRLSLVHASSGATRSWEWEEHSRYLPGSFERSSTVFVWSSGNS